MSRISKEKREKIMADILATIYQHTPKPLFTVNIARFLARDEEFVKGLLLELKNKKLVVEVKKNPKGVEYLRRSRWRLSDSAYQSYKQHQPTQI
ncbi:hypothetical protein BMS3Abin17_01035 [archaeon BMS3Abin17]|nr:hypothetical protein BMS3Abin17_01035 [archaeon BMS3Abin17]HDZ60311.1 hypothetical protein [Candidatus Pacearchaeota archaeon]